MSRFTDTMFANARTSRNGMTTGDPGTPVRHTWRAIDVVDLPGDTRYLDKAASTRAEGACKNTASDRSKGALKFEYSFVWPTRAEWATGQRYGYCWVPER